MFCIHQLARTQHAVVADSLLIVATKRPTKGNERLERLNMAFSGSWVIALNRNAVYEQ